MEAELEPYWQIKLRSGLSSQICLYFLGFWGDQVTYVYEEYSNFQDSVGLTAILHML